MGWTHCASWADNLACMADDPDERDWRLTGDLSSAGGGYLHGLVNRRREAHAAEDAAAAVGPDVVVPDEQRNPVAPGARAEQVAQDDDPREGHVTPA